jgi:hypothetical protein
MNMKKFCLVLALLAFFISSAGAHGPENSSEEESLYAFLEGTYHLIGRLPDSKATYAGKVVLKKTDDALQVTRVINNKEIKGLGKIETATADKIKVLRNRFIDENKNYEATYLINSDLDNYARLSGYLYMALDGTKAPGLEALFIDHQALK